jgi:hypothetical protein
MSWDRQDHDHRDTGKLIRVSTQPMAKRPQAMAMIVPSPPSAKRPVDAMLEIKDKRLEFVPLTLYFGEKDM